MDTAQRGPKKAVLLGLLFTAWLAGDLWTKHWADTSLADPHHPLLIRAVEADRGRPLRDVVGERLGLDGADLDEAMRHLSVLPAARPLDPTAPAFDPKDPVRGYYVVWRDPDLPPRRVDKLERTLLHRWLRYAAPEADPKEVLAATDRHLSTVTVSEWLRKHLRRLSEEEAAQVAREGMHPIEGPLQAVDEGATAEPGTTWLLEWRRIDVHGEWWKLLYAENPGAAFGFLKGLPAGVRDAVFLVLTVVVFLVILGILLRVSARHVVVPLALTGVLAGAVGNFVDRIRYGYVIDFIDMDLGFMHWPTYNVADIAISVGVVLMMLDIAFNKESPLAGPKHRDGDERS